MLAAATAVDGLLAGASLDQSIKQLPARHRIGALAFSVYSKAADAHNGRFWYVPVAGAWLLETLREYSWQRLAWT